MVRVHVQWAPSLGAQAQVREARSRVFYVLVREGAGPPPDAVGEAVLLYGAAGAPVWEEEGVVHAHTAGPRSAWWATGPVVRCSAAADMAAGRVGAPEGMGCCSGTTRLAIAAEAEGGRRTRAAGGIRVAVMGMLAGHRCMGPRAGGAGNAGDAAQAGEGGEGSVQAGEKSPARTGRSRRTGRGMGMDKVGQGALPGDGTYIGCRKPSGMEDGKNWAGDRDSTRCRGLAMRRGQGRGRGRCRRW